MVQQSGVEAVDLSLQHEDLVTDAVSTEYWVREQKNLIDCGDQVIEPWRPRVRPRLQAGRDRNVHRHGHSTFGHRLREVAHIYTAVR
jgi:hypothetical protein